MVLVIKEVIIECGKEIIEVIIKYCGGLSVLGWGSIEEGYFI